MSGSNQKFWKTKNIFLIIAILIFLVILLLGFYFVYTPDYKSSVRAEILKQLNEKHPRTDLLTIVFEIDAYDIAWSLTGDKWYSHNARYWQINGKDAVLTDDYFAVPINNGRNTTISIFKHLDSGWVFDQEISPEISREDSSPFQEIIQEIPREDSFHLLTIEDEVLMTGGSGKIINIFRRINGTWSEEIITIDQSLALGWPFAFRPYGNLSLGEDVLVIKQNDSIEVFNYMAGQWASGQILDKRFLQLDESDSFEWVALDKNRLLIVSCDNHEEDSDITTIHILKREDGNWILEQEIIEDNFPEISFMETCNVSSVSMHGDRLVIGDSSHNIVYIFIRESDQWVLEETISEETFPEIDLDRRYSDPSFGRGVAIRNNLIVVTESVHAVYLFVKDEDHSDWRLEAKILEGNNRFGIPKITDNNIIFIPESETIHALKRSDF